MTAMNLMNRSKASMTTAVHHARDSIVTPILMVQRRAARQSSLPINPIGGWTKTLADLAFKRAAQSSHRVHPLQSYASSSVVIASLFTLARVDILLCTVIVGIRCGVRSNSQLIVDCLARV